MGWTERAIVCIITYPFSPILALCSYWLKVLGFFNAEFLAGGRPLTAAPLFCFNLLDKTAAVSNGVSFMLASLN